jgi:NAD(P)-dependent dehydrogenase (short-subunit alcohol dehydrogenase family)
MKLTGTQVVVIGGSSGMGLATARRAIDEGADVTVVARNAERLAVAGKTLGNRASTAVADAADEGQIAAVFEPLDRVDHVITFAGEQPVTALESADIAQFRRAMEARVWAGLLACRYAVPKMPPTGSVTFCSGMSAHRPRKGRSVGASATAGLESFGRAMAIELAPIRVNNICPGPILTPMLERTTLTGDRTAAISAIESRVPLGKLGAPEDIADAAIFLMLNGFTTGVTLHVDGGMTLL